MTRAIAEFEAAIVIVTVTLSLAYLVYADLGPLAHEEMPRPVFLNSVTSLGGAPNILAVRVNSSSEITLEAFDADGISSASGVLAFDGSQYSASSSLCAPGKTTFFAVYSSSAGQLGVTTDGSSWIAGSWARSASVGAGSYTEVMIDDGSSCSVTIPDGYTLTTAGTFLSSIPLTGSMNGTSFSLSVPGDAGQGHQVLMVFDGDVDAVGL